MERKTANAKRKQQSLALPRACLNLQAAGLERSQEDMNQHKAGYPGLGGTWGFRASLLA